jgi:hypothetical protein
MSICKSLFLCTVMITRLDGRTLFSAHFPYPLTPRSLSPTIASSHHIAMLLCQAKSLVPHPNARRTSMCTPLLPSISSCSGAATSVAWVLGDLPRGHLRRPFLFSIQPPPASTPVWGRAWLRREHATLLQLRTHSSSMGDQRSLLPLCSSTLVDPSPTLMSFFPHLGGTPPPHQRPPPTRIYQCSQIRRCTCYIWFNCFKGMLQ